MAHSGKKVKYKKIEVLKKIFGRGLRHAILKNSLQKSIEPLFVLIGEYEMQGKKESIRKLNYSKKFLAGAYAMPS